MFSFYEESSPFHCCVFFGIRRCSEHIAFIEFAEAHGLDGNCYPSGRLLDLLKVILKIDFRENTAEVDPFIVFQHINCPP